MALRFVIEWMDRDIREAIAAKAIAAALFAPLPARFEFAEAEQQRIKIKNTLGPERIAGDVTDAGHPLLDISDAEGLLRETDGHALRIEHPHITKMEATLLFDNRDVGHQGTVALKRLFEVVHLKTEMVKTRSAARFMQFRTPLQEGDVKEAI